MAIIRLMIIILCLFVSPCFGKTYYISWSQGDDTNDGLAPERAWKTTDRFEWMKKSGGDVFLFRRGDDWTRENRKWPLFLTGADPGAVRYGVYGDETEYLPVLGAISVGSNTTVEYLHVKTQKRSDGQTVVVWRSDNVVLDHLVAEGNWQDSAIKCHRSNNITIRNCVALNGNDAAIVLADGRDALIEHNYCMGYVNGIIVLRFLENNKTHSVTIRNNECLSISEKVGAAIEIGWGAVYDIECYSNLCYGNNYGIFVSGHDNLIYNNVIRDYEGYELNVGIRLSGNRNPKWQRQFDAEGNKCYNNTVVTAGIPLNIDQYSHITGMNYFRNNIFLGYGKALLWVRDESPATLRQKVALDYNCWFSPKRVFTIRWSNSFYNYEWRDYQRRYLTGPHSLFVYPDISFSQNMTLLPSSPCIDAGARIAVVPVDYTGGKRGPKWDIGAYEF